MFTREGKSRGWAHLSKLCVNAVRAAIERTKKLGVVFAAVADARWHLRKRLQRLLGAAPADASVEGAMPADELFAVCDELSARGQARPRRARAYTTVDPLRSCEAPARAVHVYGPLAPRAV